MSIGEYNIHYKNIKLVVKTNIQWSIIILCETDHVKRTAFSSIVGARTHIGVSERPTTLYHFIHIIITHNTMPTLAELSTFSALPQGQQTILRITARINEVLRRCHQQGVEPSLAVLWHIEDALSILWPHPVITEVATVIYGKTVWPMSVRVCQPPLSSRDFWMLGTQGQTVQSGGGLTLSLVTLSKIKRCRVSSMDYILNQTASEDGEIKEIPMEEYDTRRCGQCNLNDRHCEIQDQVQSDGAYECTHCAEHGIRCWPPAGWALPLLYAMRDHQMSSRGCDIVTHKDITKQIEALIYRLGGGKYLKYTDEQQDMLLVACRIIEAVRARDQGNTIRDKDFKKHLKQEVDTAIMIQKRSLEHLSVHPAIKLASSLWEGKTVTPLDELTMESITKACQKSKREGVLSSTDLEEVNTEGATQGAAEQEEGSSPTPQNTYITEEGTVNMIKKDYKKDRCSPCNYAKLECTMQPDAFETRNYECIRSARDLQKQIKKLTEVLKDGTAGRPDRPIPSPSVSLRSIHSAVPSPILFYGHNLAEGVAGPSRLPAGSSTVRSTGAPVKRVSSTSRGRK
ncbi:hypothetical protein BC834DRAFT_847465 [Gloeopeniophorella convolvens]|nr:hypothetical protein BC834DRAFT_847465 [Gloeopeniophorella convolvens]